MQFVGQTDRGNLREINEDKHYFDAHLQLFAIADGMGGHDNGEVASKIAIETVQEWAKTQVSPQGDLGPMKRLSVLRELAEEANHRVHIAANNTRTLRGMGTTLIAGFVTPSYLTYVHVGDSRLYLLRDGTLTQITTDDTVVQEMVNQGEITIEESRVHEKRNRITRAIGLRATATLTLDAYPLNSGDVILACTDGLHDMIVDDTEIADIILTAATIEAAAENLVQQALAYGGTDNVTTLLFAMD